MKRVELNTGPMYRELVGKNLTKRMGRRVVLRVIL